MAAGGSLSVAPGGSLSVAAGSWTPAPGGSLSIALGGSVSIPQGGSMSIPQGGSMSLPHGGLELPSSPPQVTVPPSPAVGNRAAHAFPMTRGSAVSSTSTPTPATRRSLPSSPQRVVPARVAEQEVSNIAAGKQAVSPRSSLPSRSALQPRNVQVDSGHGSSAVVPLQQTPRMSPRPSSTQNPAALGALSPRLSARTTHARQGPNATSAYHGAGSPATVPVGMDVVAKGRQVGLRASAVVWR